MAIAQPASPVSLGALAQLSSSLLVVVALIVAVAWALKRFKITAPRGTGTIAVLDQLALGPRERILLIRVGGSQLLVGVGAGGLVALTPLANPIVMAPEAAAPAFADRLREFMKRPGGPT
jgi:flagellar protein FliO/FliZ